MALTQTRELVRERTRRGRSRRGLSLDRLTPFAMIAPSVALIAVFVYGFIGYSGFSSLTRWNSVVPDYTFVGLRLREAARVDGASAVQAFRYVILPQLNPIVLSAVIILGHISLKIFDLIYVMTFGGPGHATDMPGLYMFIAIFQQNLYAYGAAIATVLLLMVAVLVIPYLVWNLHEAAR